MKKLLAILTVMCMVLTTLVVPTVAFADGEGSAETTKKINVSIRGYDGTFSAEKGDEGWTDYSQPLNVYVELGNNLKSLGYTGIKLPTFDDGRKAVAWKICKATDQSVPVKESWSSISNEDLLDLIIDFETDEQLAVLPVIEEGAGENIDVDPEQYKDAGNKFFDSLLDRDGNNKVLNQITVNAVVPSNEAGFITVFEPLFENKQAPDPLSFEWYPASENDFSKIELVLGIQGDGPESGPPITVMSRVVKVNYIHNDAIEQKVNNFIKRIKLKNRQFNITDMELINYWYNVSLTGELSGENKLINYSSEFKKAIETYNFSMTIREGTEPTYYSFEAGTSALIYDDTFYGLTPRVEAKGEHIIYVDENTKYEDLEARAEERIKKYMGNEAYTANGVDITATSATIGQAWDKLVNDFEDDLREQLSNYEEELDNPDVSDEVKEEIRQQITEYENEIPGRITAYKANEIKFLEDIKKSYPDLPTFTLKINGLKRDIVVLPVGERPDPAFITKDFATDVEISTNSSGVPLDSMIEADKSECENVLKEQKGVTDDNSLTYDLKIHSKTLAHARSNSNNGYITKLDNGEFEVVVPIKDTALEGKELVAYYVYTDGPGNSGNEQIETHQVTVKDGYAAFTTNHFSKYTLAPVKPDNSPDTGDNFSAVPLIAVMAIAVAGVAAVFFRKKTVKY